MLWITIIRNDKDQEIYEIQKLCPAKMHFFLNPPLQIKFYGNESTLRMCDLALFCHRFPAQVHSFLENILVPVQLSFR